MGALKDWVKQDWVRIGTDGKIKGKCGTSKDKKNPDRCLPRSKANSLSQSQRASTAKKKKNSLLMMFHPLIVEMHKRRGNGLEDYFETNNIVQIKRMVSQMYIAKAKANFWDRKGAVFSYLWKSIIFNPRNVDSYRTLFYILRNRNDKNQ